MERKYAQMDRETNRVDLIGDETLGMPLEHPAVYTVDIAEHPQRDEVEMNMIYDPETDTFAWPAIPEPEPEPTGPTGPTEDELFRAAVLLNQAQIQNRQTEQDATLAAVLLNQAKEGTASV